MLTMSTELNYLLVSLDWPVFIAPSVFSNVYLYFDRQWLEILHFPDRTGGLSKQV